MDKVKFLVSFQLDCWRKLRLDGVSGNVIMTYYTIAISEAALWVRGTSNRAMFEKVLPGLLHN